MMGDAMLAMLRGVRDGKQPKEQMHKRGFC